MMVPSPKHLAFLAAKESAKKLLFLMDDERYDISDLEFFILTMVLEMIARFPNPNRSFKVLRENINEIEREDLFDQLMVNILEWDE